MKNLKVAYRMILVFSVVFMAFLLMAMNSAKTSNDIFETMNSFYDHPYTVTNASKNIKIGMQSIHTVLREMMAEDDSAVIIQKNSRIIELEQTVLDEIRTIEKRFLGDKQKVILLRDSFNKSVSIHHSIINAIMIGDNASAESIANTIGAQNEQYNVALIDELLLVAEYIANDFMEQTASAYSKQENGIRNYAFAALAVLMLGAWILSVGIQKPLNQLLVAIETSKNPDEEIILDTERRDEIGIVSAAFIEMVEYRVKQQSMKVELLNQNFKTLFSSIHLSASLNTLIRADSGELVDYVVVESNTNYHKMVEAIKQKADTSYFDVVLNILDRVANLSKSLAMEVYLEKAEMHFHITAFPLQEDQVVILFEDITKKVLFENQRVELMSTQRNQQKLESIGTLAGGVAHEINNPINGIMNYGQLIVDSTDKDTHVHTYAKEVVNESTRIAAIVKNLLLFSRHETLDFEIVSVSELLSQVLSLIRTIIRHDQIDLEVEIDTDCPEISCRPQQIQQVILNLLTNARSTLNQKYPNYHENKQIKIQCACFEVSGINWLRVTVEDFGMGIHQDVMEKIYDPFFSTKTRSEGTGLGLSISYNIVKDHDGKLYCESKIGEGTKFYLELPYLTGNEQRSTEVSQHEK